MINQGYKPHQADFQTVRLILFTKERLDLVREMDRLCDRDQRAPNPFIPWLERSLAVTEILKKAYGAKAPESATKIHNKH